MASFEKVNAEIIIDGVKTESFLFIVPDEHMGYDVLLGRDVLCTDDKRIIIQGDECWVEPKGEELIAVVNDELQDVLQRFAGRFSSDITKLGKCNVATMSLNLTSIEPINLKPYRIPFAQRPLVRTIIDDLLANDIVRPSVSPYASPIVLVGKKDGTQRMCVDYCQLNKITVREPLPMRIIDELFAQLAGSRFYTLLGFYETTCILNIDRRTRNRF